MARIIEAESYVAVLKTSLSALASEGHATAPRGRGTRELQHVVLSLGSPRSRFPRIRYRNANVFALFAETLWVLAGRDDLAFIENYLPRMADYSDDGVRLSGAYGPRLRDWHGVDQLRAAIATLTTDRSTRRAAISLFDPAVHHDQASKDIPCCTSLQFTRRDTELNLCVFSRSMDIMWGSAINFFEWTTLQEAAASWLQLSPGEYTHVVGSLHIYDEFLSRAARIAEESEPDALTVTNFDIPFDLLDDCLREFFRVEALFRTGRFDWARDRIPSAWLAEVIALTRAYWIARLTKDFRAARGAVAALTPTEATTMALEQLAFMERSHV